MSLNNYLRYYNLRASPYEQQMGVQSITQPSSSSTIPLGGGSSGNQSSRLYRSISQQPIDTNYEQSPYHSIHEKDVQLPPTSSVSASTASMAGDKQLQYFALEKQNECLRKEKCELENQISQLKTFYTRQSGLEQQELARYQKEKAVLVDKLRAIDDELRVLKDTYSSEIMSEKQNGRKQRLELENKLERITQHLNEQLSRKQEELLAAKNQIKISDINTGDITAKLKIFEQTNKDLRSKWDADIKNFGVELESINRQLLKERYRNEELERIMKLTRASLQQQDDQGMVAREVEILRQSNAEQRSRIQDLEKRLKAEQIPQDSRIVSATGQIGSIREVLTLTTNELDRLKFDYQKKQSENEIFAKQIDQLQDRIIKLTQNIVDKDNLVEQMLSHIESIERQNTELEHRAQIQDSIQMQQPSSIEIEYLASELRSVTSKNRDLEDQLARNPQKYHLLSAKIDAIHIQFTHLSDAITLADEIKNLSAEIESAKKEVAQIIVESEMHDISTRVDTGHFSPQRPQQYSATSAGSGLRSEFKKVTIPDRLIKINQFANNININITPPQEDAQLNSIQEAHNSSHQTFGDDTRTHSAEQKDMLYVDTLVDATQRDQDRIGRLLKSTATAISLSSSSIPLPQHPILLSHSEKSIELDIESILSLTSSKQSQAFPRIMEGTEMFELIVGFIGPAGSGKSTVIQSIMKEEWDKSVPMDTCSKKLLIKRYACMQKRVGLLEANGLSDDIQRKFVCTFSQVIVLFFKSWDSRDKDLFNDYIKLLQNETAFTSECIVIHSNSDMLSSQDVNIITADSTRLQEGLYRGKIGGKLKKINVYHILLHDHNDKSRNKSIFDEAIAVCRGTIIGKLSSNIEKTDLFKKLNMFMLK